MYASSTPGRVLHQGPLVFLPSTLSPIASTSKAVHDPFPSGRFYVILRGTHLHTYRGDPHLTAIDDEDGVEIVDIKLESKGWNLARVRPRAGKGNVIELCQELPKGAGERTLYRKGSNQALGRLAEGFVDENDGKRGLFKGSFSSKSSGQKVSRSKSISGTSLTPEVPERSTMEEPLILEADDATIAQVWIVALNQAFASLQPLPPPPTPSKSRSIPISASFSNIASLLRPPPTTPRSRVTVTAPSPEKRQVSDWAQSVRRASTTTSTSLTTNGGGQTSLRSAKSQRSLSSPTGPRSQSSASSVKSEKSTENQGKGRFLGGLLGKRTPTKPVKPAPTPPGNDLQSSFAAFSFSSPLFNSNMVDSSPCFFQANSGPFDNPLPSASHSPPPLRLAESLPATSDSSNLPRGPKSTSSATSSNGDRREQRIPSHGSSLVPGGDRGSISSFLSNEGDSQKSFASRPNSIARRREGGSGSRIGESGTEEERHPELDYGRSSTPFLEHIVSPMELLARMQGEQEEEERRRASLSSPRPFSSSSTTPTIKVGRSASMVDFGAAGGLSPFPRSPSKGALASITRSTSKGNLPSLSAPPRKRPPPSARGNLASLAEASSDSRGTEAVVETSSSPKPT